MRYGLSCSLCPVPMRSTDAQHTHQVFSWNENWSLGTRGEMLAE